MGSNPTLSSMAWQSRGTQAPAPDASWAVRHTPVVQRLERVTYNRLTVGSNPPWGTILSGRVRCQFIQADPYKQ